MILQPGQTYSVKLTVRNASTRGGQPTAAKLGVGIFAMARVMLIERQLSHYSFGLDETRAFSYSMYIPYDAGGPGAITAWVESPDGIKLAKTIESILISGYTVSLTGHVSNAETGQALGGVVVEMWEGSTKLASISTDSSGYYRIEDIPVPITIVLKYSKSGYVDTVTQPIELGPTGGGLDVELIPLVPTQLALYYSNPNNTGATHWNAWDLDRKIWLTEGLPKLITEGISFVPEQDRLFLVFREAKNQFFDITEYGPYVVAISGLGSYTWDARAGKLNGVSAINLMGKSGTIKGIAGSLSETNVSGVYRMGIKITEATTLPGKYFVGKTILADTTEISSSLSGTEISGTLKIQANPLGGSTMYPGFAMVISGISYPGQVPANYYETAGAYSTTYNDNGSFRSMNYDYRSKHGYSGIPITFKAYVSGVQRSLVFVGFNGAYTYRIGDPGTVSVTKTLPSQDIGYWMSITNYGALLGASVSVTIG